MHPFKAGTLASFAAALLLATSSLPALALEAGQAAPDIDLPGAPAPRLSELKGKVVYVDFWASWCGPCKQSFPWMNDMQKKYGAQGLQIVAINLDAKREDADAFLKTLPPRFAVAFDAKSESAKRFGIQGLPTAVLIGRDGKVLNVHNGFRENDRAALEARLAAAVQGPGAAP
jgi:cytochrome c biogenesis protein CcmG/thiol:disulfide interchange protein DsbE